MKGPQVRFLQLFHVLSHLGSHGIGGMVRKPYFFPSQNEESLGKIHLHERATGPIFATVTRFEPPGFTWHRRHDPHTIFFVGQNEESVGNIHLHERATDPIFATVTCFEQPGFTWHRRHGPQTIFFVGQNEESLRNIGMKGPQVQFLQQLHVLSHLGSHGIGGMVRKPYIFCESERRVTRKDTFA